MLKVGSKRRRTKQQIAEDKERVEAQAFDVQQKVAQYEALQAERDKLAKEVQANGAAANLLNDFIKAGTIVKDAQGNWVAAAGQAESAQSMPGSKHK